jgi:hypothetical protein
VISVLDGPVIQIALAVDPRTGLEMVQPDETQPGMPGPEGIDVPHRRFDQLGAGRFGRDRQREPVGEPFGVELVPEPVNGLVGRELEFRLVGSPNVLRVAGR